MSRSETSFDGLNHKHLATGSGPDSKTSLSSNPLIRPYRAYSLLLAVVAATSLFAGSLHAGQDTWLGVTDGNWATPTNWSSLPVNGDSLFFTGVTPFETTTDNIAGLTVSGITFDTTADPYTLLLAAPATSLTLGAPLDLGNGTTSGGSIVNNSANNEVVKLPLILALGKHAFTTGGAGTLDLSGATITRGVGVTAVFTNSGTINITGSGLANDGSASGGILGGWATIGNDWAAISGTNVVAYTGYTAVATGAITGTSATTNLKYSADTGNLTAATGTTMNSLLATLTGASRTLTITGTMKLGANGGIYRTANSTGNDTFTVTGGTITANGGGEITLNDATGANGFAATNNNLTINSIIANDGTHPVAVNIMGYVVLAGVNTYTGGTVVDQGRIQATGALTMGPVGSNITILPGSQVFFNTNGTYNYNWFLNGIGSTESGGLGAIRAPTSRNIAGSITLQTTSALGGGNGAPNVTASITGPGGLIIGHGTTANGNGSIHFGDGTGTQTYTYQGDTIINQSSGAGFADTFFITAGSTNLLPNGPNRGNFVLNGGTTATANATLDLDGTTQTINGLNSGASASSTNSFVTSGTAATLTVGANNANGSFAGAIQNQVSLIKTGSGTQTLSSANTYVGNTTVTGGTLLLTGSLASPNILVQNGATFQAGGTGVMSSANSVTLGSGAASGTFDLAGSNNTIGGLSSNGTGTANIVGNSSTTSSSTLTFAGGTTTFGGNIQDIVGAGTQQTLLTVSSGTLTLAGANTYTGATTINGGTLRVTGSVSNSTITTNSGGTLLVNTPGTTGTVMNTGGILGGNGSAGNVTTSASIRPGLTAADGSVGTLTMSSLIVNGGDTRLDLVTPGNNDKVVVTGTANFAAASTVTPASAPAPSATPYTILTAGTLTGIAPTLSVPSGTTRANYTVHFGDLVANQIQLVVSGAPKTLTWTGTDASDPTAWDVVGHVNWTDGAPQQFFNQDTVNFGNGPTSRTINLGGVNPIEPAAVTVNNSAGNDYSFNGSGIGDSGLGGGTSLTKMGTGTLTLNNPNTYLGATAIQNGKVVLGNFAALPTGTALSLGDNLNDSAVLDLGGNPISVSALSTIGTGAGNVIGNSSTTNPSTITITNGTNTVSGVIKDVLGGGTQTVGLNISPGASTASLLLTADSTYTGGTQIDAGATLQLGTGGATGGISATTPITLNGTLIVNRSTAESLAAISGGGAGQLQQIGTGATTLTGNNTYATTLIAAGTLQVGTSGAAGTLGTGNVTNNGILILDRSDTVTVSNVISGAGSVQVIGTGTTTLSGANTYSGATTITSGAVLITNTTAAATSLGAVPGGAVTISNGGTLDLTSLTPVNATGFGAKQFIISGQGVANAAVPGGFEGAIFSGSLLAEQNVFQKVTLAADATVGGAGAAVGSFAFGRYDLRGGTPVLDLAGHTLTKVGSSQFTLVATTVTAGNIIVASPGAFGAATQATLGIETTSTVLAATNPDSSPSTITFNDDTNLEVFQTALNGGSVTRQMIMNGTVLVSNGNATALSTVASPITDNGILRVDSAISRPATDGPITLTGNISGPGSLVKANNFTTAILTLSGNNSYSGGTIVSGGTIKVGSTTALGLATGALEVDTGAVTGAGTLDLNGFSPTVGALNGNGGTITSGVAGAATLTVGSGNASGSFAGVIQDGNGKVGLTKIGSGTEVLTGSNTYTGATQVQGGTLQLGTSGAVSAATSVTLGSGSSSGTLDLGGFNNTISGLSTSGTGTANVVGNSSASASILTFAGGASSFGGTIKDVLGAGTSTTALTVTSGSLTLSGANIYTGDTTLNGGTLTVTAPGSLNSAGNVVVNAAILGGNGSVGNVSLQTSTSSLRPGVTAADGSIGTLSTTSLTVNGGDMRLDLVTPGNNDKVVVTGTANFVGASTITPTSAPASSATPYTILTAGTLTGTAPTFNVAPGTTRTTYTVHFGDLVANQIQLVVTGSPKTLNWTGTDGTDGTAWDVVGHINWTDGAPQQFFNQDTVIFGDGPTNLTINLGGANPIQPTAVTVNNSAGNDYSFNGAGIGDVGFIGGTSLTKMGTGTLTLNFANTYLGPTAIQNGKVVLGAAGALPSGTSLTLGSGTTSGVLDLNGNSTTVALLATSGTGAANIVGSGSVTSAATLTVAGGASVFGGVIQDTLPGGTQTVALTVSSGSLTLTGNNTYTGATTVSAGATLQLGNGGASGSLSATTGVNLDGTLIFDRSDTFTVGGAITESGTTGTVQQIGSGTTILTGVNTYGGATTINAGILSVSTLALGGNSSGIGASSNAAANLVLNGGTLQYTGAAVTTDRLFTLGTGGGTIDASGSGLLTLSGTGAVALAGSGTRTLTVAGSGSGSLAAVIADNGGATSLSKTGGGSWTLTGLNTFTGNVLVTSGTLIAQNAAAQNAGNQEALGNAQVAGRTITVNSGAMLEFSINNVFGNQTNPAALSGNLPAIIVNGGTVDSTHYNQIGNVTLNAGTLSQTTVDNGTTFSGYQFRGAVTVGGTAASTISSGNGKADHLGPSTTFNVADATGDANVDLTVSAPLRDQSNDYLLAAGALTKTGVGTMALTATNIYTGGTTVNSGTLTTTATGTIGGAAGTLAVNATDTITSVLNLGNSQTVSSLSGTLAGSGTAQVNVAAGTTLTVNQTTNTTFAGNLVLATGATANSGGTLTSSGTGTLEIDGAPTLGANSNINVSGGTLRFNVTPTSSGSVFVGTGVTATVTNTAVLELAGSISALDPLLLKGKANVVNNSTAAAGLLVSGTNQLVGFVDGSGTTQVNAGSDLTASHIVQGALVIGGTAMSAGLVTIDPSDANGNPLAQSSGMALAGSLQPSGPFGAGTAGSSSMLVSSGSSSAGGSSLGGSSLGALSLGGGGAGVPEPSTLLLMGLGSLACLFVQRRRLAARKR